MSFQPSRNLLNILRSTVFLASYYRESEDGPRMSELKVALANAIAELEDAGTDLPADQIQFDAVAPWKIFNAIAVEATQL